MNSERIKQYSECQINYKTLLQTYKTEKPESLKLPAFFLCDPDRIQTYNLLIRSQILYSVELRGLK
jgi:hypothetical protein